jgi:hypothetical protein
MPSPINTPTNERLPSHLWTIRSQSQTLNGLPFTKPSINSDIHISLETDSLRAQDTDMDHKTLSPNSSQQLNIDETNSRTQLSTTGMSSKPLIYQIFSQIYEISSQFNSFFRTSFQLIPFEIQLIPFENAFNLIKTL